MEAATTHHRIEVKYIGGPKDGETMRHDMLGPPDGALIPPVMTEQEVDEESGNAITTYCYHPVRIDHRPGRLSDVLTVMYLGP